MRKERWGKRSKLANTKKEQQTKTYVNRRNMGQSGVETGPKQLEGALDKGVNLLTPNIVWEEREAHKGLGKQAAEGELPHSQGRFRGEARRQEVANVGLGEVSEVGKPGGEGEQLAVDEAERVQNALVRGVRGGEM